MDMDMAMDGYGWIWMDRWIDGCGCWVIDGCWMRLVDVG